MNTSEITTEKEALWAVKRDASALEYVPRELRKALPTDATSSTP